jgi:ribosome-associated protein
MIRFSLDGRPFVTLNNLLKFEGLVASGASAKQAVAEGLVEVDGQVELRKRCKLIAGQVVSFAGTQIVIDP